MHVRRVCGVGELHVLPVRGDGQWRASGVAVPGVRHGADAGVRWAGRGAERLRGSAQEVSHGGRDDLLLVSDHGRRLAAIGLTGMAQDLLVIFALLPVGWSCDQRR